MQRRQRDRSAHATENLRFVLEATNELDSLTDASEICSRLASIAATRFADWCIVTMIDPGGHVARAAAHREPGGAVTVQRDPKELEVQPDGPIDIAARRNRASRVTSAECKIGLLRALNVYSAMIVPIVTQSGAVLGTFVLASSGTERHYDDDDLLVAGMIARRAASALGRAETLERERNDAQRFRFLSRASEVLFEGFDVRRAFERLVNLAVDSVADVAMVVTITPASGVMRITSIAARDGNLDEVVERLHGARPMKPEGEAEVTRRLSRQRAFLTREFKFELQRPLMWEYAAELLERLGIASMMTIAMHARDRVTGAIVLGRSTERHPFENRDLTMAEDLGRGATIAISQAEIFERERRIATELQHAMLPNASSMPAIENVRLNAFYHPSSSDADIGGDWYDAFSLHDGSLVVSVGDVIGRGLPAAGLMGELRQALAVTALYETDPARALDTVDFLLRARGSMQLATVFFGIIDPDRRTIRFANAGHPYPLLKLRDGLVSLEAGGLPLGLRDRSIGLSMTVGLEDAEMLVLYTDGLVEATRDLIQGEARLREVLERDAVLYASSPAEMICQACLPDGAEDDAAVLTVGFRFGRRWTFDAENARAAQETRGEFIRYLRANAAHGDFDAAEVIFGELIGNVVRHAPGPIDVHIAWEDLQPTLHVTDRGRGFERRPALPEDPLTESGRGLFIVELLSDHRFSVEYVPGYGTHVAVELPVYRDFQTKESA
jgi:GAF domain-containing protein/anti-sigma regulatory factor (Ser/Thr protein kinase)